MKEHFLPLLIVFLLVIAAGALAYKQIMPYTKHYLENQIVGVVINDVGVDVKVADTEALREQGLSGTTELGERNGLLMIFDKPDFYAIWMKDMNYPLDIIWIDNNFRIVDITESLLPDSYPSIFEPKVQARMALEVNARFAATYHIKVGDTVRLNEAYIPKDLKKTK